MRLSQRVSTHVMCDYSEREQAFGLASKAEVAEMAKGDVTWLGEMQSTRTNTCGAALAPTLTSPWFEPR